MALHSGKQELETGTENQDLELATPAGGRGGQVLRQWECTTTQMGQMVRLSGP